MLTAALSKKPEWHAQIWGSYGGEPSFRAAKLINGLTVWSGRNLKSCFVGELRIESKAEV